VDRGVAHDPPLEVAPAHLELLLPAGKSGWVAVGAVKPLSADQLCFAKQPSGDWKIAAYDQGE